MKRRSSSRENKTIICDGIKMLHHSPIPSQIKGEDEIDQGKRTNPKKYVIFPNFIFTPTCLLDSSFI
jgi:hypothetical protein